MQEANQNLSEKQTLLVAHERKIAKVREDMAHTHRLFLDGSITSQGFKEFYMPAEEQLNQLVAELPKLQAELDLLKVNNLSADEVLSEAQTLCSRAARTTDRGQAAEVPEAIVEKIVIGEGEIDITLSICIAEEMTKAQQQLREAGVRASVKRLSNSAITN